MQCAIYKSRKRLDTYLYLARKDAFDDLPPALRSALGGLVHVMDLELTPQRRLAHEDVDEVRRQLADKGWFLQLPRREDWAAAWRGGQD